MYILYFLGRSHKKNYQMGKKYAQHLEIFCQLNQNLCEFHTFKKKEKIVLESKNNLL